MNACRFPDTSAQLPGQARIAAFVISLPRDAHRRHPLEQQLRDLDISYSILHGVDGAALTAETLAASYDARKARRLFNRELSRGEIGCALSHLEVYRTMVERGIPYALVLEDDAKILDEDLSGVLSRLAGTFSDDTPVAVLLNHVGRVDANTRRDLDDRRRLYEAYRGVCAHGYFITQAAAKQLALNLYPIHAVADKWEYFQERFIQVNALIPYPIGLTAASHVSTIDGRGVRHNRATSGTSPWYYIRRYAGQLRQLFLSRPFRRIEYQETSESDV